MMADSSILRFNQSTVTGKKGSKSSYQIKRYPEGVILYTTSAELPDSLSANALIFTTDTAELYVGTGTGIQKLKLGSEEDLDPAIYLKIDSARATYQSKLQAEAKANEIKEQIATLKESVYSKEDIDKFVTEDIDLDGVIDKMNLYTVERINQLLEERATAADVYTRTQADAIFDTKAEKTDVEELSDKHNTLEDTVSDLSSVIKTKAAADNVYTKTEIDTTLTEISNNVQLNRDNIVALQSSSAVASEVAAEFETVKNDISNLQSSKADQTDVDTKDLELANNISVVSRDLEDFTVKVYEKTAVDDKFVTVNSAITSVDNKIKETASNIRSEIAEVNSAVVSNQTAINDNTLAITDNKTAIETATASIADLQEQVNNKIDAADVYTKTEIADLLTAKANLDEVFKKIDTYSAEKIQELFEREDETDLGLFYTKTEVDSMLSAKADQEAFAVTETRASNNKRKIATLTEVTIPGLAERIDIAVRNSNDALESANDTKTVADNANNTAIEAKASADFAKTTATEAKSLASSVSAVADTANEKSNIALDTARAAEDTVNEAVRASDLLTTRVANVELNCAAIRSSMVDAATLTVALDKKADLTLLDFKASKAELESGLSFKADKSSLEDLQETVANKADKTYVDSLIATKDSDIRSFVNSNLETVNNDISDIRSSMADASDVDTKLAQKADASKVYTKEEVDELINDAVTQVLNELTFKLLGRE